jgi:protein-disulfide isomerase
VRIVEFTRKVRPVLHLAVTVALMAAGCGGVSPTAPSTPTPTTPLPAMSAMLSEKVLGSPTAPVTMIEYSSLTCSHCGDFHIVTFPLIKTAYIDTGRVRFVYRDFPLNEPAIVAGMVARCSGDRYFTALDALFSSQAAWASAADYTGGIKKVVAALGMTSNDVDACLASTELRSGILSIMQGGAQDYGINATPSFVINGQKVVGALSYAEFSAILQSF